MTARFDPFQEMERWLNTGTRTSTPTQGPLAMDLFRQGDAFVAKIDLPGVDPSSIDIDVDDRTLTLRAERRPTVDEDVTWLSRERESGTFARQLALGRGLATDRIEADYTDGVLTLTIPVAEEAKPRKITVNHSSSPAQIEGTQN
ncbi:Hsp20/alpha crystallin family protein [Gephyromycinifex aptenodytis]|uniref:Hsp20/alpha crystallin family protein n=1 Tax=Gephyromycinifex aptenodytis TaxID=2716227 RepID=UPI001445F3DC|nr:Hsp20/alpha crystallin family protein [Gephyromycinifex aptenodytis]